jgi:hypothetical protein
MARANTPGESRAQGSQSRMEMRIADSQVKDPEKTSWAANAAPRTTQASPLRAATAKNERGATVRLGDMVKGRLESVR